jgi:hypothetical protein
MLRLAHKGALLVSAPFVAQASRLQVAQASRLQVAQASRLRMAQASRLQVAQAGRLHHKISSSTPHFPLLVS